MSEQIHELETKGGSEFEVAVSGPETADTALILVHGFGVRRDSRGLFTDIAEATDDWALTVRADFSKIDDNKTEALPFTEQTSRIKAITAFCIEQLDTGREIYIGHSMGWLPIALSKPISSDIVALAPPLGRAYEKFIKTPGWSRPGSRLDVENESILERSDGSTTSVSREFWDEFRELGDVTPMMSHLGVHNRVNVIFAGEDNVLGLQDQPQGVASEIVDYANHDFVDAARQDVVDRLIAHIKPD